MNIWRLKIDTHVTIGLDHETLLLCFAMHVSVVRVFYVRENQIQSGRSYKYKIANTVPVTNTRDWLGQTQSRFARDWLTDTQCAVQQTTQYYT